MPAAQFISARVMHARLRPKQNRFSYRVPYLAVPLAVFEKKSRQGLLSIDGANLFSVRSGDYGDGTMPAAAWIRSLLEQWQLREADGDITLVTMPRILGFVFNPVSFWMCFDRAGALRAVIAEVNNTFGERHFYVCCHDDHRPIGAERPSDDDEAVPRVAVYEGRGDLSLCLRVERRGDGHAHRSLRRGGLDFDDVCCGQARGGDGVALGVIVLRQSLDHVQGADVIHYQAVRLFLKGVSHFRKPPPPAEIVTR